MRPRSIAVVGATDRPASYGAQALLNLDAVGYPGEVWGVNPRRTSVLGRPCVPSVSDLPEAVDAVVVAIPAAGVASVLEEAGARGCGGAVVFSAGFAEFAGGVGLQADLVAAARRYDLPVCGPNCNGIVATHARTALWGDALTPREPGAVALISQSGNVAVNALATRRGLRFHTVVASGNQAVLSAADYLGYLAFDEGVGSIALYLEDDGGPGLCDGLAACAEAGVRVAVLKVGSSNAGARAAAAHSGALAGDQRIFRALIEEAGAVWADDVHDLLELAKTLAVSGGRGPRQRSGRPAPTRAGGGLAIMTCSGGDSAQGADEAERLGLALPALAPATCDRLRELLPAAATAANPLDYTAMIWGDTDALAGARPGARRRPRDRPRARVLRPVPGSRRRDQGVVGCGPRRGHRRRRAERGRRRSSPRRSRSCSTTTPPGSSSRRASQRSPGCEPACAARRRCERAAGDPDRLREIARVARTVASAEAAGDGEWLSEHEAKELLRGAGVTRRRGSSRDPTRTMPCAALAELGGHIALKLSAPGIQHKSDVGAIELGLRSEAEVRARSRGWPRSRSPTARRGRARRADGRARASS